MILVFHLLFSSHKSTGSRQITKLCSDENVWTLMDNDLVTTGGDSHLGLVCQMKQSCIKRIRKFAWYVLSCKTLDGFVKKKCLLTTHQIKHFNNGPLCYMLPN